MGVAVRNREFLPTAAFTAAAAAAAADNDNAIAKSTQKLARVPSFSLQPGERCLRSLAHYYHGQILAITGAYSLTHSREQLTDAQRFFQEAGKMMRNIYATAAAESLPGPGGSVTRARTHARRGRSFATARFSHFASKCL